MKKIFKSIIPSAAFALTLGITSCTGDLDVTPISPKLDTELNADQLFNKCYANLAMCGMGSSASGDDNCDVAGYNDAGMTGLIRQMINANCLTTDEALCSWGDDGLPQYNFNRFDASAPMLKAYFARLTLGISFCNHYIEAAGSIDERKTAEIRFVRALQYYLLMDAFGNVPFTEVVTKPTQMARKDMYEWLEKELLEIEPLLGDAKPYTSASPEYVHANKGAVWMLLSRLYLNAEVYTGTPQWSKASEYAKKVIAAPYELSKNGVNGWTGYQMLFMGDNGESSAAKECIFPIYLDSKTTKSYGSFTFLVCANFNDKMHANKNDLSSTNGATEQWGGYRARPQLIRKFFPLDNAPEVQSYDMINAANDDRAIFCSEGRTLEIEDASDFTQGYGVAKVVAFKSDGSLSFDPEIGDGDFFFFRLAEAYLTVAECDARMNGNATTSEGTKMINDLRDRARATTREASYSLDEILDEWSREFYFEGRRRVDLIRFNKFAGNTNYNWQWKGGVKDGRNFADYMNVFAIPANELVSNSNLKQNPGY